MLHRLDNRLGTPQESVGRSAGLDNAKVLNSANLRNSARGTTYNPIELKYLDICKVGQSPGWEGWTKWRPASLIGGAA